MPIKNPVTVENFDEKALFSGVQAYQLVSGMMDGRENMQVDEALLVIVCRHPHPILIVRVYGWKKPTWSLGVNQPERDIGAIHQAALSGVDCLNSPSQENAETTSITPPVVIRRPTGGRAILHGDDISYAIATNVPGLLRLSVRASYCVLGKWVQAAVRSLGVPVTSQSDSLNPASQAKSAKNHRIQESLLPPDLPCGESLNKAEDYSRSPQCFETRMADDLVIPDATDRVEKGQNNPGFRKVAGSAQLRRTGGLLQHGSLFLQPWLAASDEGVTAFSQALLSSIKEETGLVFLPLPENISHSGD